VVQGKQKCDAWPGGLAALSNSRSRSLCSVLMPLSAGHRPCCPHVINRCGGRACTATPRQLSYTRRWFDAMTRCCFPRYSPLVSESAIWEFAPRRRIGLASCLERWPDTA